VGNLENGWDEAVVEVGPGRARVWRLYMAASALNFEAGRTQVHQVLAVRPDEGHSGLPLRSRFEEPPLHR
jgi:cyclopropane-fatty-acyl-phospholipid synthase